MPVVSIVTLAPFVEAAGVPAAGLGILPRIAANITGHVACAVVEGLVGASQADGADRIPEGGA